MFKDLQKENRQHALESQGWWFRRMLKTESPLREKMTLFWHDHFATSIQKVKQPVLMLKQNELFREHAFGSFKDLTQAILLDPANVRERDRGLIGELAHVRETLGIARPCFAMTQDEQARQLLTDPERKRDRLNHSGLCE